MRGRYTDRKVSRFIQPVVFTLVVLLGAVHAAALACQWSCAAESEAARHAGHHAHATHAVQSVDTPSGIAQVGITESQCAHLGLAPAVIPSYAKVSPTVTGSAAHVQAGGAFQRHVAADIRVTASPPGPRSTLLLLRI